MLPIADAEDMEESNTTLRCPSKPGVVVGVGSAAEIDWSIVGNDVDDEVEQVNDTPSETQSHHHVKHKPNPPAY